MWLFVACPLVFDQVSGWGVGSGLGWVGLVALLGVIMDRSPSGWSVSAVRSCGAQTVGGFSNPCTVWIRVSFRFDRMCKFRVW